MAGFLGRAGYFSRETWLNVRRNLTLTVAAILTVAVGVMLVGLGLMAGGIFLLTKRKFKSEKWQFEVTKKVEQE